MTVPLTEKEIAEVEPDVRNWEPTDGMTGCNAEEMQEALRVLLPFTLRLIDDLRAARADAEHWREYLRRGHRETDCCDEAEPCKDWMEGFMRAEKERAEMVMK